MKNVFDILDELDNRYENKDWSINEAIELAIEETSKAKDEKFIKILDELSDYFESEKFEDAEYCAHQSFLKGQIETKIEEVKRRFKGE